MEFWCRNLRIYDVGDKDKQISFGLDADPLNKGEDFGKVVTLVIIVGDMKYTFSRVRKEPAIQ